MCFFYLFGNPFINQCFLIKKYTNPQDLGIVLRRAESRLTRRVGRIFWIFCHFLYVLISTQLSVKIRSKMGFFDQISHSNMPSYDSVFETLSDSPSFSSVFIKKVYCPGGTFSSDFGDFFVKTALHFEVFFWCFLQSPLYRCVSCNARMG